MGRRDTRNGHRQRCHQGWCGGGSSGPAGSSINGGRLLPRRFALVRHIDYTGVSGVGVVAYGVVFADGHAVLRWPSDHPATSLWNSLDDLMAVHGHGEATNVEWLDPQSDLLGAPSSDGSSGRRARRAGPASAGTDDEPASPATATTPPPPGPPFPLVQGPQLDPVTSHPAHSRAPALNEHPATDSPLVPPQRRTGRHRRAAAKGDLRSTQPIESDTS